MCGARRVSKRQPGTALLLILAISFLALSACAVGPYADTPQYKRPKTRTTAARQLNEALAFGGIGVSEVAADELKLTWHEYRSITAKRKQLIDRELDLQKITAVSRPKKPGEWWEVKIEATGGAVIFTFKEGPTAAKAETALRRLMEPITEEEQKALQMQ